MALLHLNAAENVTSQNTSNNDNLIQRTEVEVTVMFKAECKSVQGLL